MSLSFKIELGQRLKDVRESMGLTQKQFCVFFGSVVRSVSAVSEIENGERNPPLELFFTMARKGVNLHWLFTGEGEMYQAPEAVSYALKEKEYAEKLIEILRHKDEGTISAITQNIDTFLKVPGSEAESPPGRPIRRKAANTK